MPGRFPAVAVAAVLLAACVPSAPPPLRSQSQSLAPDQVLKVRLAAAPRSLDPALVIDGQERGVVRLFAEPLLKAAHDGQDVVPAAAAGYEVSTDGLTWTFRLRTNARYSDGQPVRAADFVAAWRRLIDPRTAAPNGPWFAAVVKGGDAANVLDASDSGRVEAALDGLGLSAPDDYTFVVRSPEPAGRLKWIATLPEGAPWRADMAVRPGTIANGPFFVQDSSAARINLSPNPSYWAGRPTLSRIGIQFGGDGTGADIVAPAPPSVGPQPKDIVITPELTTFWVTLNTERPPLDNVRVRQAIAQALARDALADGVFKGRAEPATTLVPRGMRDFRPEDGHAQETNLPGARALLEQSGAPKDQLVALPLIVPDRPQETAFAQQVAAQLGRDLGISIAVQPLRDADFRKRLRSGDFALAAPRGWTADYPDPSVFFDLFRSSDGNNASRWRNPRYDQLVRLADTGVTDEKRDPVYSQAQQLLAAEAPVAFAVDRNGWAIVRSWVRGAAPAPGDEWPGAGNPSALYITSH